MRELVNGRGFGAFFAFAVLIVCLLPTSALAATAHEYERSFGPDGTSASHFEAPGPLAVDQETHDVYVIDLGAGTVSKFDQDGLPVEFTAGPGAGTNDIGGFSFFSEEAQNQIAVDNSSGDFYVASYSPFGTSSIKVFESDGEEVGEVGSFEFVFGVAVDATGNIYAAERESGVVDVFTPGRAAITSFPASNASNLATDSTGAVYVAPYPFSGLPVKKFVPSEFPPTPTTTYSEAGAIDPKSAYGVAVDPANDDLYVDERTAIAQFKADGTPVGTFAATGAGALTASEGLAVDAETGRVFVSDTGGERQVEIFVPPPPDPPEVGSLSFSNVTTSSADLQAQVNPKFFDTHYRFQYIAKAKFEENLADGLPGFEGALQTPEGNLGSAGEPRTARGHLAGLRPDTTYLFRVAAENENNEGAPVFSAEAGSFATFALFPPGLPDGRAYEMVSPPQKLGEVFAPLGLGGSCKDCLPGISLQLMPMQSAPDGGSVAYGGQPFSAGLASGQVEYLSRRSPSGWGTQGLSSPLFNGNLGTGFVGFSRDLSRGVLFQREPALSPQAPTRGDESYVNLYLREGDGTLRPLVVEEPPSRDPGVFNFIENANAFRIVYAGANSGTSAVPAFNHLIFEANDALTQAVPGIAPKAPEVNEVEAGAAQCGNPDAHCNLYEWVNGRLRLVNVLPANEVAGTGAVVGSGRLVEPPEFAGEEPAVVDNAISADGSRIFWSEEGTGQVYVRVGGTKTLEIPGPGRCKKSFEPAERVCFLSASADGSEVLLSDGQIYALDEEAEAYEPTANLAQDQGGFQGILGAAEDLSHIYFVDTTVLTGGEENANEEQAEDGKPNLYAWNEGITAFVGTLVGGPNGDLNDWKASRSIRTAQVSTDGNYLAFMSTAPLTGYDNERSDGGICNATQACSEVFEYAAASGSLTCASCNPSGRQPLGPSNLSLIRGLTLNAPLPQPGNLSAEGGGRLFFESQDALSPRDTNGHIQDVYEWEPNGVGSCKRVGGCVFLISSGTASKDSMLLDSTPSGEDAFIVTREQLLPRDKDQQLDLYDARAPHVPGEAVGFPEGSTPPCGGDACKGAIVSPPAPPGAASSKFSGPGNPKKAHHKKKHKKHKKHKKRHQQPSKHNRGGSK